MITRNEARQIRNGLFMENGLSEEISRIVYYIDVHETGDDIIIRRHVDIEYCFGEYYEICEGNPLFQLISTLCDLPLLQEEQEIAVYQREDDKENDQLMFHVKH